MRRAKPMSGTSSRKATCSMDQNDRDPFVQPPPYGSLLFRRSHRPQTSSRATRRRNADLPNSEIEGLPDGGSAVRGAKFGARPEKAMNMPISHIGLTGVGDRYWGGSSSFLTAFRSQATVPRAPVGLKLHYGQHCSKTGASGWAGVARSRRRMS